MRKKIVLYFIFTILILSCEKSNQKNDQFKFEFFGAWGHQGYYLVDFNTQELEVCQLEKGTQNNFENFKVRLKLNQTELLTFYNLLQELSFTQSEDKGQRALDGQSFAFSIFSKKDTIQIVCMNPSRYSNGPEVNNFELEYKALESILYLGAHQFRDERVTNLSHFLYNRYGCSLKFRLKTTEPLEYAVWGFTVAESMESDSLNTIQFMENLPVDEPILVDKQFLNEAHFQMLAEKPNLYFFGDGWLKQLKTLEQNFKPDSMEINIHRKTISDSICNALNDCIYSDSVYFKHWCYHEQEADLFKLQQISSRYFVSREEALKAILNN